MQCLESSAKSEERSVLILGSLCLPCCMWYKAWEESEEQSVLTVAPLWLQYRTWRWWWTVYLPTTSTSSITTVYRYDRRQSVLRKQVNNRGRKCSYSFGSLIFIWRTSSNNKELSCVLWGINFYERVAELFGNSCVCCIVSETDPALQTVVGTAILNWPSRSCESVHD